MSMQPHERRLLLILAETERTRLKNAVGTGAAPQSELDNLNEAISSFTKGGMLRDRTHGNVFDRETDGGQEKSQHSNDEGNPGS